MPRLRAKSDDGRSLSYERTVPTMLDLILGPCESDPFTDEQLRVAWEFERERLMRPPHRPPGTRPWAFWVFDVGEDPPPMPECREPDPGTIRLAELGELTAEEIAGIREDANASRARIGTDSERISGGGRRSLDRPGAEGFVESLDRVAVLLCERVEAAMRERTK